MATAFGSGNFIAGTTSTSAEAGAYVPEIWSNEVIAPYKANRILADLVTNYNFKGQKGDTLNIPTFVRGVANAKAQESVVTPNVTNSTLTTIAIDKHIEYTVLIEKFAEVQALASMRKAYVEDAGYAIARKIDWDLHLLARSSPSATPAPGGNVPGAEYADAVIGSNGSTAWNPAANTNAGNAAALADAGIRRMLRTMDDNNVPQSDRCLIIPPVEKESLLGIARFTEQAFVGDNGMSIRQGMVGSLYNTPVYVTSNCPTVLDAASGADQRAGMLLHKAAFVLVTQLGIESVMAFLSEFLATQLTWHTIYGVKEVRATNVIPFIVPA
jgi:hypothetical protein